MVDAFIVGGYIQEGDVRRRTRTRYPRDLASSLRYPLYRLVAMDPDNLKFSG